MKILIPPNYMSSPPQVICSFNFQILICKTTSTKYIHRDTETVFKNWDIVNNKNSTKLQIEKVFQKLIVFLSFLIYSFLTSKLTKRLGVLAHACDPSI